MANTWNLEKINQLISIKEQENLNLEYKSAKALENSPHNKKEITKDVSAMANSAGGIIIYGIKEYDDKENKHLPEKIDAVNQSEIKKEWLEQVINTISPKIDNIIITPISVDSTNGVVYVLEIPQSDTAHQAQDLRYYKRFNFMSEAMQDYEIRDVMGRNKNPKMELSFIFKCISRSGINTSYTLVAKVTNIGSVYAKYLNIFIEIPKIIIPKNMKVTTDTHTWEIKNTERDLITESKIIEQPLGAGYTECHFEDKSFTEGPSRYVPILPCLSKEWEFGVYNMSSERASLISDEKITWKIYADNASPLFGETLLKDIEHKELYPHA